jgi:hypothetical protein
MIRPSNHQGTMDPRCSCWTPRTTV